ncbi:Cysteine proteinase [Amphibalanus amphitrite]|uniref:Cysteine proteinase n=1 Tax=Amphibalanus amphitrite TaxID=1232801 RepID=A0A6A4W2X8_AMPAM|nr:Cysteine proteinase [Amphibalanus amphitrite]
MSATSPAPPRRPRTGLKVLRHGPVQWRLLAPVAPAARPPGHSARAAGVWLWTGGSKDWRDEGAVTPVRYRTDRCGSGGRWAFAAADTVESAWKIAGNPLVVLSEQQLIDCSTE